ncbi:MAG: SAVED domain-containing protein [Pleomorphochaeta sp.]
MSRTKIPQKTQNLLWAKAGGRCEFPGCNKLLYKDLLTRKQSNLGLIAHNIADSADGPRGDKIKSEEKAKDIDNLLLLCPEHHKIIDDPKNLTEYTVEKLALFKKNHEERIERLTNINESFTTQVVIFGTNIGNQTSPISKKNTYKTISDYSFYPASDSPITIGLLMSANKDHETSFWISEKDNLIKQFEKKIKQKIEDNEIQHLSVFALAPQPLLILLGSLLSDIVPSEIYQLQRSPQTWHWKKSTKKTKYKILQNDSFDEKNVALVISLSQRINHNNIKKLFDYDIPIWEIYIDNPNCEYLENKNQVYDFKNTYREIMNQIQYQNGENTKIHVFCAVPASIAVEMGKSRFPKTDPPLVLYDYNKKNNGFFKTIEIK